MIEMGNVAPKKTTAVPDGLERPYYPTKLSRKKFSLEKPTRE